MGLAALPLWAAAQGGGTQGPGARLSITSIGQAIANATWVVFTVIAIISFVIAGILFLTAAGEGEKLRQARMATLWGVAGVIVAIMAFGIVNFVEGLLGGA